MCFFSSALVFDSPVKSCVQLISSLSIPIGNAPEPTAGSQTFTLSKALRMSAFSLSFNEQLWLMTKSLILSSEILESVRRYAIKLSRHMY